MEAALTTVSVVMYKVRNKKIGINLHNGFKRLLVGVNH